MAAMTQALTDAEYDRITSMLARFSSERAMNLEMLDGFFAALVCSPDMVRPSEYLREIWGGAMSDDEAFGGQSDLQTFLELVMRHWNTVVHSLNSEDVFLPLLLEGDDGVALAND